MKKISKQIIVAQMSDGKPIRMTVSADTIQELDDKVSELLLVRFAQYGIDNVTFEELGTIWISGSRALVAKNTHHLHQEILKKYLNPHIGSLRVQELESSHLRNLIQTLEKIGKPRRLIVSIKHIAVCVINLAMDMGVVKNNIFRNVSFPRRWAVQLPLLTEELRALVIRTYNGHIVGVPALLLVFCGLRRSELLALKWDDVDAEKMLVSINKEAIYDHGKPVIKPVGSSARQRNVPIPSVIFEALMRAKEESQTSLVCSDIKGNVMSASDFAKAWASNMRYLNAIASKQIDGTPLETVTNIKLNTRMIRRSYALTLIKAGVSINCVAAWMGYQSTDNLLIIIPLDLLKKKNITDTEPK